MITSYFLATKTNTINIQLEELFSFEVIKEEINLNTLGIWNWIQFREPDRLNQCDCVPLGPKLVYTNTNVPTLTTKTRINYSSLGAFSNKVNNELGELGIIDLNPVNVLMKIGELPQTCGVSKSICPIWIRPTDNFLTHSRTSSSINEIWSRKCNKYK